MTNFGKGSRIRERAKQQRRGVIVSTDPDQDGKKRQWLVRFDGDEGCVPRSSAQLCFDIDYKKLLDLFKNKGRLIQAKYYTALLDHEDYSPIHGTSRSQP